MERVGASQEEKLCNSAKHFQEFLGNSIKIKDLKVNDITFNLLGEFGDYLATYARRSRSKEQNLISLNTARGYFSAVVSMLKHKFRDEVIVPRALEESHLSKIRNHICAIKYDQARKNNQKAVQAHDKASEEDRKALGALCVWDFGGDSAVMLHLVNSMIHCVGRASEVSSSRKVDVSKISFQNNIGSYTLITHFLHRMKVNFDQDLLIYPHRNEMLFCYYWSAGYASIMERGLSTYVFPGFFENANKINKDDRYESKVSKTFKASISRLSIMAAEFIKNYPDAKDIFSDYSIDNFNHKLTSHAGNYECDIIFIVYTISLIFFVLLYLGKKTGVNIMCSHSHLAMPMICFRAGFDKKNLHSLYDYCMKDVVNDRRCGMVLAGWTNTNSEGNMRGGFPPLLEDVSTQHNKIPSFVKHLFEHETGYSWEIKQILTATILRFYKDFIKVLESHPNINLNISKHHPFIIHINEACVAAKVPEDVFLNWCEEVEVGFHRRNVLALDIKTLQEKLGNEYSKNVFMDSRTFLDVLTDQGKEITELRSEIHQMKKIMLELQVTLGESVELQKSMAFQVGANSRKINEIKCPVCYPRETLGYEYFQLQWKQSKNINEKIYSYFANNAAKVYDESKEKTKYRSDFYQKKTKVIDYLKHQDVSLDEMNKLPNEDNEKYLLRIKECISSLPRKKQLLEDSNELVNAQKSVCGVETVHLYESFCKEWTKKKKLVEKAKIWFYHNAELLWESFPQKQSYQWKHGFHSKKKVIDEILLLSDNCCNEDFLKNTERDDHYEWTKKTKDVFLNIQKYLDNNKIGTTKNLFEFDKKRSAAEAMLTTDTISKKTK